MVELVFQVKFILGARYNPDGYNIGINVGAAAGQTIFHLHLHIIPRYKGDVPTPGEASGESRKAWCPTPRRVKARQRFITSWSGTRSRKSLKLQGKLPARIADDAEYQTLPLPETIGRSK